MDGRLMSDATVPEIIELAGPVLDETIEAVRWCRNHLADPDISQRLREMQVVVSSLALALDYGLNGEPEKAEYALGHADPRLSRYVLNPHEVTPNRVLPRDTGPFEP
jgi:hypothetical protein